MITIILYVKEDRPMSQVVTGLKLASWSEPNKI